MKYLIYIVLVLIMTKLSVHGQENVLTYDQYMILVQKEHPLSVVANIQVEKGKANVQSNRGSFDPSVYYRSSIKDFDGSEYYDLSSAGLKIPTWFGIDLQAGMDKSSGDFLNPQNTLPEDGQVFAGASVPIGQGLFMDKRRAELKKAKIYMEMSEADRSLLLNDLLYQAGKAYWDWYVAYHRKQILEEGLNLAIERLEAVEEGARLGDRRSMDTVEAGIQVQNRRIMLREATMEFQNAGQFLSVYLWREGRVPMELEEGTQPEEIKENEEELISSLLIDSVLNSHPEIQNQRLKISELGVEEKWKKEQLKPTLNIKYNLLSDRSEFGKENTPIGNNYAWGLEFSMPILLRRERGELRMTKLRIQEAEMQLKPKLAGLRYKVLASRNEYEASLAQIETARNMSKNYHQLLEGEKELFNAGESSLFLVNQRELGFIKARIKVVELKGKNQKAALKIRHSLGKLGSKPENDGRIER